MSNARTFPSTPSGVRLLNWVHGRLLFANLRMAFKSKLKAGISLTLWLVLLAGLYGLALWGIRFLYKTVGLGMFMLGRLWFLLLFVMMIMLVVSQLASGYSTIFRSSETGWWTGLPIPPRLLARAKYLESSFYSSWAVVVLLVPLCVAYLQVINRPLWLLGWIAGVLVVPLLGLTTAVASIFLLVWLRWVGRILIRRELILVGLLGLCALLFWFLGEQAQEHHQEVWFIALQEMLPRMRIAMSLWMPSAWAATALDAVVNGRWAESRLYAALLWTTLFLAWRLFDHTAAILLFPVLRQHAETSSGLSGSLTESPRVKPQLFRVAWWMRHPLLASIAKDAFSVIRDPVQWSQALMFFGLLGIYFANIHRLASLSEDLSWRIGVASLNCACTLLVFGSLAVRFLFPQLSIEGRGLWLLRVAPKGTRYVMYSKLILYSLIAVAIVDGLLLLSEARLGIPMTLRWWLAGVGAVAAVTLVGMTCGLGAYWMDPTATDAARVVSSSNGALMLVGMLVYIGSVIFALTVAWTSWNPSVRLRLAAASGIVLAASLLMGIVPVWMGLKRLDRSEEVVY